MNKREERKMAALNARENKVIRVPVWEEGKNAGMKGWWQVGKESL